MMNRNHVYAQKAARAIANANAESNLPAKARRRKGVKRTAQSAQSSWGTTTSEYMGDGFSVRGTASAARPNGRTPRD